MIGVDNIVDINSESILKNNSNEVQYVLKDFIELKSFITHDKIIKPNILSALAELGQCLPQKLSKRRKSKITDFF